MNMATGKNNCVTLLICKWICKWPILKQHVFFFRWLILNLNYSKRNPPVPHTIHPRLPYMVKFPAMWSNLCVLDYQRLIHILSLSLKRVLCPGTKRMFLAGSPSQSESSSMPSASLVACPLRSTNISTYVIYPLVTKHAITKWDNSRTKWWNFNLWDAATNQILHIVHTRLYKHIRVLYIDIYIYNYIPIHILNYGQTPRFARACRRPSSYVLKPW